jgi:TRAP-type mannitol/chloroaromatic compound transport system substrate-binding protein
MQRRAFLKQAALGAAGSAAIAAPAFAQEAPTVAWRLASSFPNESPTLFAGAEDVARYVAEVTDGRFTIEIFPAGDLVQPGLRPYGVDPLL